MRCLVAGVALADVLFSDGSRAMFAPAPVSSPSMNYRQAYGNPAYVQQQAYGSPGYVQLVDAAEYPVAYVQPMQPAPVEQGSSWSDIAMLAIVGAAVGGAIGYHTKARAGDLKMFDISAFDNIWGFEAKKACYDAWDPEKPRDYNNFNPFERNDESAMADTNGCFPGQSRGYKSPIRPDQSWDIMQKERQLMDELAKEAKFNTKGKPGNFSLNWQKNLGAPP